MNKIGVHALSWVGGWSEAEARTAIEGSARLGYDLVEIPMLDTSAIDTAMTRRVLQEASIAATVSLGLDPTNDITSSDPDIAQRGETHLKTVVTLANEIGATHVCGVIHSAMKKYMEPATDAAIDQSADILRRVCAHAEGLGIEIGLEVVNRYESNVLNTAAQGVALCDRVGAKNVKVHLDTYHMNIEEADSAHAIMETGDRLGYFHIGESHRGYLGSGSIDFDGIFRSLARIGYGGPIVFESFSSEVVNPQLSSMLGIWRNLWSDGEDLCRHAFQFTTAHLHAARKVDGLVKQTAAAGARDG